MRQVEKILKKQNDKKEIKEVSSAESKELYMTTNNEFVPVPEKNQSNNIIIKVEKDYLMYKNRLEKGVTKLNVKERINKVNNGDIGAFEEVVRMPLGYMYYLTREQGLTNAFTEVERWAIINSPFNREPFLSEESMLVKKVAYLIRALWGDSGFNFLPVSLISNPHNNSESDIIMHNCLLAKDRGHFMTVMKMFVNDNLSKDVKFWKKVRQRLIKIDEERKDTSKSLKVFTNTTMQKLLLTKDEFTLEEILPSHIFNNLWTAEKTIEIRLETIDTHKAEIKAINQLDNNWEPHNHSLTELTDTLIKKDSWGYSQLKVDKVCADNYVLRGEHHNFLSGRGSKNFSGYQTEPLMLFVVSLKQKVATGLYKFLSGPENDSTYVDSIYKDRITTEVLTKWSKRFISVAELISSNGINLWLRLSDAVDSHYKEWQELNNDRTFSGFLKVKASSMDTALLYVRYGAHICEELGLSRDRESTFNAIMTEFIEHIIDFIETETNKYEQQIQAGQSWKKREENFFQPQVESFIRFKKAQQQGIVSVDKLKKLKTRQLRDLAKLYGMPMKFKMFDRRRRNGWEIVEINLESTGQDSGLQLSHYLSEANGGLYTDENTFMGPALDNNYKGSDNVGKNHLYLDGEFFTHFQEDVEQPTNILSEEMEAYLNTKKFCEMIQNG